MGPTSWVRLRRLVASWAIISLAATLSRAQAPVVVVVDMTPNALSGEGGQDSEPFLAINPKNPSQLVATSFTTPLATALPAPNQCFASGSPAVPLYFSADGGNTWYASCELPSPLADVTVAFSPAGNLYAAWDHAVFADVARIDTEVVRSRRFPPGFEDFVWFSKGNPKGPPAKFLDQPFIRATSIGQSDHTYLGVNDLSAFSGNGGNGRTATIVQSLNASDALPSSNTLVIESRDTSGQDGPSIRPATAKAPDGTVYAALVRCRAIEIGIACTHGADIVVVRDDTGGSGPTPYAGLVDTDGKPGKRVVSDVMVPFSASGRLGQERVGPSLALAVDPNNTNHVYIAWGQRDGTSDVSTLHVRSSTDRGLTWSADLATRTMAINPALAVGSDGTLGFLFQQLTTSSLTVPPSLLWTTEIDLTADDFGTTTSIVLASPPANSPAATFLPYLGDYLGLVALGTDFYGVFSANNTPNLANFPNGVRYLRNANFGPTAIGPIPPNTLFDLANPPNPVPVSIDPFFFRVIRGQAHLTLKKTLVPPDDPGAFYFSLDSALVGDAISGSSTGPILVTSGPHGVSEVEQQGTKLGDYFTTYGGDCGPDGSITLIAGDDKSCMITNRRKPPPQLTVKKIVLPSSDLGSFSLWLDGSQIVSNARDGSSWGPQVVTVGPHQVLEKPAGNTNPQDYVSTIGGDCAPNGSVTLDKGDLKTCTVTNYRTPQLTLLKQVVPPDDSARFRISVDGVVVTDSGGVGDGGIVGPLVLSPQKHRITEASNSPRKAYRVSFGEDCAKDGTVTLSKGDIKSCSITNTSIHACLAECQDNYSACLAQGTETNAQCLMNLRKCQAGCRQQ